MFVNMIFTLYTSIYLRHAARVQTHTHTPLVGIQKKRLNSSRDWVQSCNFRRAVRSFHIASILEGCSLNICLCWNGERTQPVKNWWNIEGKQADSQIKMLTENSLEVSQNFTHSGFFQSTSTILSTPFVSSFTRTRWYCCCMAWRNLDNYWIKCWRT